MASSDNVVRAGLTPKFKDKETLCNVTLIKFFSNKLNKKIKHLYLKII